ncbi:hypothetical protein M422DRAFT_26967 [Sphaerobolus stellatus SS14]|nr:hypothetical protein M422DRAFT_26967 [Sphaerobolus stellatus SS14]
MGSKRFFDALDATDKMYKSFPGGYHELHNEPDRIREGWHETCLNWIDRVVGSS